MQEFKKIFKEQMLKYFFLALFFTIASYFYIRYGWAIRPCGSGICHFEWNLVSLDFQRISQYPISAGGLPIPYMFSIEPCHSMEVLSDNEFIWSIFFLDIFLWMLIFTVIRYFRERCGGGNTNKNDDTLPSSHSPKQNEN
jgi:hypothetical protein